MFCTYGDEYRDELCCKILFLFIEELFQANNTVDFIKINNGKDIEYDQYDSLLHASAAAYDIQFQSKIYQKTNIST